MSRTKLKVTVYGNTRSDIFRNISLMVSNYCESEDMIDFTQYETEIDIENLEESLYRFKATAYIKLK
jgi:SHS2 domain-containing protein